MDSDGPRGSSEAIAHHEEIPVSPSDPTADSEGNAASSVNQPAETPSLGSRAQSADVSSGNGDVAAPQLSTFEIQDQPAADAAVQDSETAPETNESENQSAPQAAEANATESTLGSSQGSQEASLEAPQESSQEASQDESAEKESTNDQPEPTAETTAEPIAETNAETNAEPIAESNTGPIAETNAEPIAEPIVEANAETNAEANAEPEQNADPVEATEQNAPDAPSDETSLPEQPRAETTQDETAAAVQKSSEENKLESKETFSCWNPKKEYLGGFRDKRTGVLYFNSAAQTTTPQELRDMNRTAERFHRDTQTVDTRNRTSQDVHHVHTQMTSKGRTYISTANDRVVTPKHYQTADEWEAYVLQKVVQIQCWVRCVYAKRTLRRLQAERKERNQRIAEREAKRESLDEKRRQRELEAQLHPRSNRDFERLYHGLEVWRLQETEKINAQGLPNDERLKELAQLLNREATLIQQIDHLRADVAVEVRERRIATFLDKVSAPKKWRVHSKDHYALVDTPTTIRARELRDLQVALTSPLTSMNERLQVLLNVKYTVKEFDCQLTRTIVGLIDREADLLKRGRDAKALEGLRRRIGNLFFQFVKTPEFNPEAANLQKFPQQGQGWAKTQQVYYCRGCTQYLPSTAFYLSTTMKHLGRCKACVMQENIATARRNELVYANMLHICRLQEEKKRLDAVKRGEPCHIDEVRNVINLLQESDLEYVLSVMWHNASAINGSKNMDNLILTRWDPAAELSPWNCILLTNKEAIAHDAQRNPMALYGDEFCAKVHQKLLMARQHFQQLPSIAKYLVEHYVETPAGVLILRAEAGSEAVRELNISAPASPDVRFEEPSSQEVESDEQPEEPEDDLAAAGSTGAISRSLSAAQSVEAI